MFSWATAKRNDNSNGGGGVGVEQGSNAAPFPGNRTPPGVAQAFGGHSRSDHVSSLLNHPKLKRATRRVSRDDSAYDTVFQTVSGNALILRVQVAPREGAVPSIALVGVEGSHPWLDSRMRVVGYLPVTSDAEWSRCGKLLGDCVSEIVEQLQLNPPNITRFTDKSLERLQKQQQQSQPQHGNGHAPQQHQARHQHQPPSYDAALTGSADTDTFHMPIPEVPSSFPELQELPPKQVRKLIDDPAAMQDYCANMSTVTTINDLRTSLTTGNVTTAKETLAKEEDLGTLHAEVQVLKSTLKERIDDFSQLERTRKELCKPVDPRAVAKRLNVAKRRVFVESEKVASDWLEDKNGGEQVDEFISQFMEKRMLFHVRAAKIERLNNAHRR